MENKKTKLKTLKDLGFDDGCSTLIKAEAVKWVKEDRMLSVKFTNRRNGEDVDGFRIKEGGKTFAKFHNITEEDLK